MKQQDLIFLSYADNSCYPSVTDQAPTGVSVNFAKGEWSYGGKTYKIRTKLNEKGLKIWDSRRRCEYGSRHGPIGAYDKSDIKNLKSMMHDWMEAGSRPSTIMDD